MFDGVEFNVIEMQTGRVKIKRNIKAFGAVAWTLCGTLYGVQLFKNPNILHGLTTAVSAAFAVYHGREAWHTQQELNELQSHPSTNDHPKELLKTLIDNKSK